MALLVEAHGLERRFDIPPALPDRLRGRPGRSVRAVAGVDLSIARGETRGLIGESGYGKSTLGRVLTRLQPPSAGAIRFDCAEIGALPKRALRPLPRRGMRA
jgi:ABC-type oligopeptide transport system ATPase subunit